ncbi:hypothetical protein F9C07_7290 [Aspergillus flavus]|uniref:Uncharacterized protein n=1 Tax=Aspergillus flavus (strain ATCC 200026 / FGSC A1120 / IAM 13836 / NRRL 3357 / JCM 12722 / SRRC 167) TaxID=332952 RepID=A0A7U2QVT5_ASPFN|nr:hypothetical protein F9C07_7290 [Aspergillus flavus]
MFMLELFGTGYQDPGQRSSDNDSGTDRRSVIDPQVRCDGEWLNLSTPTGVGEAIGSTQTQGRIS